MTEQIDYELCNANDLENDSMKEFEIKLVDKTYKVLLIKHNNNKFSCVSNKCTHYEVPLSLGVLYKGRLRCMAHGTCFNLQGDIEDYPGPDCLPIYKVYVTETNTVRIKTTRNELEAKRREGIESNTSKLATEMNAKLVTDRSIRVGSAVITRPKTSVARPGSANSNATVVNVQPKANGLKCLIIGSGAGGLVCADTLRENGLLGSNITIVTKDSFHPYDRPKLSKGFNIDPKSIIIRDESYFTENNINLHRNQEVDKIDFNAKKVSCKSGKQFTYDKLVLSTGLIPIDVNQPGRNLKGIFTLRSMDDAIQILEFFKTIQPTENRNIVLVGGSFISMEAVCYFVENAEKANNIVMSRNKPFENIFGKEVATKILNLHQSKGVQFIIEKNFDITEFKESETRPGHLGSVVYKNDKESTSIQSADICILAIGAKPTTDFLSDTKLKMNNNKFIIVDDHYRTNIEDVYAVGDITLFPVQCLEGLKLEETHVNIQHWSVAGNHGRSAALDIINQSKVDKLPNDFKFVPFFWTSQFKKSIRFAGYNKKYDSIVFHADNTNQNPLKFAAFYLDKEQVVGVTTLDWDPICAIFAEALHNGYDVKREHIDKDPMDIKKLLV